ncbi:MAG: DUF1015 domain-containing protein [Ruminococcaceae bacterium]|nr:DUF1015 domain-containing protein [Oscillospiraceae bacterium]
MKTIFSPAEILLPKFARDQEKMTKWAVIACDQFTSEIEYWDRCTKLIGGEKSTYDYIQPEAYLETEREAVHEAEIAKNMADFDKNDMTQLCGMIYLERTLPNGMIRHGIVGKIDLEEYDYSVGSKSPVRATEATVTERIPPRCKVRASASIELPHILILVDEKVGLFSHLDSEKKNFPVSYDFDLMQGGGHVTGYEVTGEALDTLVGLIEKYEKTSSGVTYAMGDGNHSLAAAKAHWENVKRDLGEESDRHPARYALCEITDLHDDSLVFEPIYRLVKNCDPADLLSELEKAEDKESDQRVTVIVGGEKKEICLRKTHALTVGSLQNFIDSYVKLHDGVVCDYIHGEESVEKLAAQEGSVGFLMDGMDKNDLFSYVEENGTLPRKTFSMGEAESKRYYLEARYIRK